MCTRPHFTTTSELPTRCSIVALISCRSRIETEFDFAGNTVPKLGTNTDHLFSGWVPLSTVGGKSRSGWHRNEQMYGLASRVCGIGNGGRSEILSRGLPVLLFRR